MPAGNRGAGGKFQPKVMSTGIGVSRLHNAPDGAFEERLDWSKLTLGGKSIPANLIGLITYAQTDQGLAENEAAVEARGGRARATVTRDPDDKKIDRFGDQLTESDGLTIVPDPLALAMRGKVPEGHRGLWMSKKQCEEKGMLRGVLEYKKVLHKNPDTGVMEEVTCGNMFLASVPEASAVAAERHYDNINRERVNHAQDKVTAQADQVMSAAGMDQLARRRRTSDMLAGLELEDPEVAGRELAEHEIVASE